MHLYARESDQTWCDSVPELKEPYTVLAPTSIWPGKRWPIERFTELAQRMTSQGHRIVVIGAPGEEPQCQPLLDLVRQGLPVIDRVGKTSVGQMLAIIERAQLVLANDSAALHMAVGFDRPIVGLFGPTRTDLVGPYRQEDSVLQHITPADQLDHKNTQTSLELMSRISTDEVHKLVNARLATDRSASPHQPAS